MIFGSIGSAIGGAIDAVADVAEDVVDSVADAAVAVGEAVVDVAGEAGGYLGDGLGAAGSFVDTITFGAAGGVIDIVDDTVFDGVDYLTGGLVDVDFDDGQFGVSFGIDGIADVGVSLGEGGLTANIDTGLASADLGLTDDGLSFAAEGGIDFGPLPYGNAHVVISDDGEVLINGHVQGTIPLPGGILSGEASGGFVRTPDGWGAFVDADGTFTLPSGFKVGGGLQASYMEDADGDSRTTFGIEGSVSAPGVGSAGAGYGYQRIEEDGTVVTTHHAEGHAEGYGIKVGAEADYVGIETAQGSFSQWTTDVDLEGLDQENLAKLGAALLGADADEVSKFLGQAAEKGDLTALLGQLDPATTTAVLERLVTAPAPTNAGVVPPHLTAPAPTNTGIVPPHLVDQTPGTDAGTAPIDDVLGTGGVDTTSPTTDLDDDQVDDDPLGTGALDPTAPADAGPVDDALGDPLAGDAATSDPVFDAAPDAPLEPAVEPVPAPEPEPEAEPIDFDQSIAAADQVEADVDAMFDDLG